MSARRVGVALAALVGLLLLDARPAAALPPPAPVTDLSASLGVKGLALSWTTASSGPAVVRDVTGLAGGYQPTDGRSVPVTGATAYDAGFSNTTTQTYAVWAAESDGTLSSSATELSVPPLPQVPTGTELDPVPSILRSGTHLTLVGRVTRGGLPFPDAQVAVLSRVAGTTAESTLTYVTSALDGTVTYTYTPTRTRTYRFAFLGDSWSSGSSSTTRVVSLAPRLTAWFSPATVQWKKASTFTGTVSPNLAGRGVVVQKLYDGSWHTLGTRTLDSSSRWSWTTAPALGKHAFRAYLPGTTAYRAAYSPTAWLTVTPRTLYAGLSGPDVLGVEKRLRSLKYYVGTVDGYFDDDLRHAVYAFQKVERLTVTGKWRSAERTRVLAPRGFTLRHPSSTSRLVAEVSITRQVLVLHREGKVVRIVDVSTGSEEPYYQEGVRYIAHTPRGVFSVYRKIDGIRVSKLGELYRPSYFYKGWAVHGSGSVPIYPASHGCVRVTNHVADLLFSTLVIGSRVAVYDE
jgi:hypothetical protein